MALTLDAVSALAGQLPGTDAADRRGSRTWSVNGKVFAWERPFTKADVRRFGDETPPAGPIVAVRVADEGEKDAVLAAYPECVFTIPHFDGFAAVLIHLERASTRIVRELLEDAWAERAPEAVVAQHRRR